MALILYADVLAKAYGQAERWEDHLADWRDNGTMNEVFVAGPVKEMFGEADEGVIGSVWAQAALDFGWLDLGRVLTADEYTTALAPSPPCARRTAAGPTSFRLSDGLRSLRRREPAIPQLLAVRRTGSRRPAHLLPFRR